MRLLDLTLPSLAENVALDEALLLEGEATGTEMLRFWEWQPLAVVVGAGGRLTLEVNERACSDDNVPVLRRSSGGGAVLLGRGCLLFSLVLAFDHDPALADLHASYRFILNKIKDGLAQVQTCGVSFQGISDLTIDDRKFSGNAQQRKRTHLLHHGTLLYAFDPAPVGRYLMPPPRQPEYRLGREHADFLTNVSAAPAALRQALLNAWPIEGLLADWPRELTKKLADEKYSQEVWIRRR